MIDHYRVTLFKKKIKEAIPGGENIRFAYSVDRAHLVIPLYMRFYGKSNEVGQLISKHLKKKKIEHKVIKDRWGLYRDWPVEKQPTDCVSIPIDQEALPERKLK